MTETRFAYVFTCYTHALRLGRIWKGRVNNLAAVACTPLWKFVLHFNGIRVLIRRFDKTRLFVIYRVRGQYLILSRFEIPSEFRSPTATVFLSVRNLT